MTAATRPLRIWICARCRLPRSGDTNPCPKCRDAGVIETRGRWFVPPPKGRP